MRIQAINYYSYSVHEMHQKRINSGRLDRYRQIDIYTTAHTTAFTYKTTLTCHAQQLQKSTTYATHSNMPHRLSTCLLYTSDAADDMQCVDPS